MTEKRFQLNKDFEWWFVKDNTIKVNEFGYRDDVIGEDKYRGLKQELTEEETVDLLNELFEENGELRKKLREDIAFKDKHISYFQNLIGDIEIEFKLKENLSKEKWEEIHEKNYQNFRFGSGDNE